MWMYFSCCWCSEHDRFNSTEPRAAVWGETSGIIMKTTFWLKEEENLLQRWWSHVKISLWLYCFLLFFFFLSCGVPLTHWLEVRTSGCVWNFSFSYWVSNSELVFLLWSEFFPEFINTQVFVPIFWNLICMTQKRCTKVMSLHSPNLSTVGWIVFTSTRPQHLKRSKRLHADKEKDSHCLFVLVRT